MKTRLILAVICAWAFTHLNAQESTKKEITVQSFIRGSGVWYNRIHYMVGVGLRYDKHCLFGGPVLKKHGNQFPVEGWFCGYNYYPAWNFKRLSAHGIAVYQQNNYPNRYHEFTLTAGYGLDFRIIDNLFLDQSFTVGTAGRFSPNFLDPEFYGPHDWDVVLTMQLGLRYDFKVRK